MALCYLLLVLVLIRKPRWHPWRILDYHRTQWDVHTTFSHLNQCMHKWYTSFLVLNKKSKMAVTTELSLTYNRMENIYSIFLRSRFTQKFEDTNQITRSHKSKDRQIPKRQTVIYKTLHRKLKIDQHETYKHRGKLRCSGRVRSYCSPSGRRNTLIKMPGGK